MTDDQWRSSLEDLKRERDNLDVNTPARRAVEQLIKDVELHLAASDEGAHPARERALGQRFSAAVERFEASHPKLTLRLNEIMTQLSGTGV